MTATAQSIPAQRSSTLVSVLRATHETWTDEVERYLSPVILREASFWERWTAVRYIADQFQLQYRREWRLLDQVRTLLPALVVETLVKDGQRIERLQRELDRVGRRRGTARSVSVTAGELLDAVRCWCGDLEAGVREISRSTLTAKAERLVAELELGTVST
jgi:hypothetical protein